MNKWIGGFVLGAVVSGAVTVSASDSIQAVLFPAKYKINGVTRELPEGYSTVNVNGHAYVPIRYVAESLGAVVAYDEDSSTIVVDDGFNVTHMTSGIRAGHLQAAKEGGETVVTGQLYIGQEHWEAMASARNAIAPGTEVAAQGEIRFYNDQGRYIGKASFKDVPFVSGGDQIREFKAVADRDVSGYAFASLTGVSPVPHPLPVPPDTPISDSTRSLSVGTFRLLEQDGFTKVKGWISLNKPDGHYRYEATLTFYDEVGNVLGTADIEGSDYGSDEHYTASTFETVGKGDLTGYKSVTVEVRSLEKAGDTEAFE
ncbi:stalk domain-containing protein [Paenibacillus thermoaerophilus]|uniref:Stalk domain-containing protein n=1 Tax=Paenibacillus thermoaerophilus TaxID=1215385 RepID=A0ABW2V7G4_9BACL|nr:stalk domain-containing protein [Paenibacillus thermoaerophilus]TMV17184.1 hypothetical protein FE781_08410 [Paenibacillus thermoaerophilus]